MTSILFVMFLAQADPPPADFFAPNEEVRGYIAQAIEGDARHPMLSAAMEEYLAGVQRVPQEKALEDPMMQMTYWTRSSGGEPRYSIMMQQMFPWFGTLKMRGMKAQQEADSKLAMFRAGRNELIAEIKRSYAEYWFLAERQRITLDQVDVLKSLEEVVRSRYALGIGGQEDLLRIEMEEAKLQNVYDRIAVEQSARAGKLNEALGREVAADLPLPQAMELPPPPPPAPIVLARIRVANPMLDQLDATIASRESEIALARKKGRPNITVGLSYTDMKDMRNEPRTGPFLDALGATQRLVQPQVLNLPPRANGQSVLSRAREISEFQKEIVAGNIDGAMDVNSLIELENAFDNQKAKDEVMISVGMNLPIWRSKVRAGIKEAEHMKSAAMHEKRKTLVDLEGAAKMAIYGIEDGYRRLKLYDETLLPKSKRTYETLQTGYAAGNTDAGFLDVLTTVQTILEFDEQRAEALRDIQIAAADLELLLGGPWTASESAPLESTAEEPSPEPK
ncbi:MAG: TolC family protein [Candidatus Hydrogenedentes bacterium]|nr:TolC family protein [Candidatus Hydrogenedentota bacterium]